MNRRQFLRATAVTAAGLLVPLSLAGTPPPPPPAGPAGASLGSADLMLGALPATFLEFVGHSMAPDHSRVFLERFLLDPGMWVVRDGVARYGREFYLSLAGEGGIVTLTSMTVLDAEGRWLIRDERQVLLLPGSPVSAELAVSLS